jgi:chaperonin GroEL
VEKGIVRGGGMALIRALSAIEKIDGLSEEQAVGVSISRRACEKPCRQIAANAGKEGSIIVQGVRQGKGGHGYDAQTDKLDDLFESGVIDPSKVVRSALQNAGSVASLLITTEAKVVEKAKDEKPAASGHGGGGVGGLGGMM